ncbi:MAG: hypothetical protein ACRDSL_18395 [Pseudonocardiaceae bacterium]
MGCPAPSQLSGVHVVQVPNRTEPARRSGVRHGSNAQVWQLAIEVGDAYCQALALNDAELATVTHGHPDDGLTMLQFGQVKAWGIPGFRASVSSSTTKWQDK